MKSPLVVRGLGVVYLEGTPFVTKALQSIDFTIAPGEIVGLIGGTGSGKSTLVQAINGLVPLAEGEVTYPEEYDRNRLFERIGLVFQQPEDQLFERTVGEDVAFGPLQLGLPADEVSRRVDRALEALGLSPARYTNRNPYELSGGEKRRVAIAGILSMEPDLLILDEPTAGLDQLGRDLLVQSLRDLHRERALTLLLIGHDMELLSTLAHRLVVLHQGRVVLDGTPKTVFGNNEVMASTGLRPPVTVEVLCRLYDHGLDVDTMVLEPSQASRSIIRAVKNSRS